MTFAEALTEAMTARGVSGNELGRLIGANGNCVSRWIRGITFPSIRYADAAADVLEWPQLRTIAVKALSKRCGRASCRKRFMATSRHRLDARFCSPACQMANTKARFEAKKRKAGQARMDALERAITAFCRSCEPEGICRTSDCLLRGFSPLPLIVRKAA